MLINRLLIRTKKCTKLEKQNKETNKKKKQKEKKNRKTKRQCIKDDELSFECEQLVEVIWRQTLGGEYEVTKFCHSFQQI